MLGMEDPTLGYAKDDKIRYALILIRAVIIINSRLESHVSALCPNKYLIIPYKLETAQEEKAK